MPTKNKMLAVAKYTVSGSVQAITIESDLPSGATTLDGVDVVVSAPSGNSDEVRILNASDGTIGIVLGAGSTIVLEAHEIGDDLIYLDDTTSSDTIEVAYYGPEPPSV